MNKATMGFAEAAVLVERRSTAHWVRVLASLAILFLLVWLPFQAPIVAILYQYAGISTLEARALILAKDVVTALSVVVLFLVLARQVSWSRIDMLAVLYVGALLVYTIVPYMAGTAAPTQAVAASLRTFLLPVELFYLGRLATVAGVPLSRAVAVFLGVAVVAATLLLAQYVLTGPDFWTSTINLVQYVRDVQGIPGADSLWAISALGHFGAGDIAIFPRAVGTFTHPVGTAHFFLVPLGLAVAIALSSRDDRPAWVSGRLVPVALVMLFALAVITPISRGAWIAGAIGIVLIGLLLARVRVALVGLAVAGLFIALVPPFSYSVLSAIGLSDTSTVGHLNAIQDGIRILTQQPLGVGVGGSDHLPALAAGAGGGDAGGVGESMYLATLAVAGPIGLLALVGWAGGIAASLIPRAHPRSWIHVGLFGIFVGILVGSAIASPLMRFSTAAGLWILLGLAFPLGGRHDSAPALKAALRRLVPSRSAGARGVQPISRQP